MAPAAGVRPGFPHGSSPWAEGPRDRGSHALQPHGIMLQLGFRSGPGLLRGLGPASLFQKIFNL